MKKPWSISTTVRNPERIRGFLGVLKQLEGQPFNSGCQMRYQILLIKNKLYRPLRMTRQQESYYKDPESEMPFSVAKTIFASQRYVDPAMRGRNSAAPLNKMGLCIAKNSAPSVEITALGDYFLSSNYDLGELFFTHFLKWQLPNPADRSFSTKDGFEIKPFLGTLHLIKHVNRIWVELGHDPIGISREEFNIFALTLIDYRNIENQANNLIDFRKKLREQCTEEAKRRFVEEFKQRYVEEFLGTASDAKMNKFLKNLKDYGDNAIRYFRLTRYFFIRGGGYYIDLERRREIEIDRLLDSDDASPKNFENAREYIYYLADIDQPELPWKTATELRKIAVVLREDIESLTARLLTSSASVPTFRFKDFALLAVVELSQHLSDMRSFRQTLQSLLLHNESQSDENIEECIEDLKTIHSTRNKKSIELERLATLALNALNDALAVKPNYPVGDDNEPTFTAPPHKPDIECFYGMFNSVCEVTMLTDRTQWYHEGPPVMRHVRDFENSHPGKNVYCLFIAPRLHTDTIETFWVAVKHGYKGTTQRIVPLSIMQFTCLLETLLDMRAQGETFSHRKLLLLYDNILSLTDAVRHSDEWLEKIPAVIDEWRRGVLAS